MQPTALQDQNLATLDGHDMLMNIPDPIGTNITV